MPDEIEIEDLWPDITPAAIVTPASILKTQATALSRKTNGLLQAEVDSSAFGDNISHRLVLVVPALENYRYSLLRIRQKVTAVYPVYVDEGPIEALDEKRLTKLKSDAAPPQLPDEASFHDWLRNALASAETKRILESLLAQATV
jgi:hypothetical protein